MIVIIEIDLLLNMIKKTKRMKSSHTKISLSLYQSKMIDSIQMS